jgi:ParB-like chromosome segregation protein Spo0J
MGIAETRSGIEKGLKTTAEEIGGIKIIHIPVAEILPHPLNPRPWSEFYQCHVSNNKVLEIINSIRATGYDNLEPIQVRQIGVGGDYQIISGHHRYCAIIAEGWKKAPCVTLELDDISTALRLVSRQGESIKPWDMAYHAYKLCVKEGACSQVEYGEKTGIAASLISKQVVACRVDEKAKLDRKLSTSACAAIGRAPESEWTKIARRVIAESLSVREIEQIVSPAPKIEPAQPMPVEVAANEKIEPTENIQVNQAVRTTVLPKVETKGLHQAIGQMTNLGRWKTKNKFDLALVNNSTLREDLVHACEKLVNLIHDKGRVIIVAEPRHAFTIINEMLDHDWVLEQQLAWLISASGSIEAEAMSWPNSHRNVLVFYKKNHPPTYFQGETAARHFKCLAQDIFRFGTSPGGGISASIAHLLLQTYAEIGSEILIPAAFEKDAIMAGQALNMKVTWLEPIETIFESISKEVS